ncbi:hypothetical protein [Candidatus Uabimicrobium sp. HlEnr_7]|uniref:hypothetical protein n=1 Tax=Candidatus Uabimicrobium helgolandensis TaxID=3095367 RepID=UPI0035579327
MTFLHKKRGLAIIVVLIALSLLSLLALSFIRFSISSRLESENTLLQTTANLTAYAGIDHALASVFQKLLRGKIIKNDLHSGLFLQKSFIHSIGYSGATGKISGKNRIGNYGVNSNVYTIKLINETAKLNVNSYIAFPKKYQKFSDQTLYSILVSLAKECKLKKPHTIAKIISKFPVTNNKRFLSNEHLFSFLRRYIPPTPAAQKFMENLSTINNTKSFPIYYKGPLPKYYELRSTIDINHISTELLYALITNIKATANFYTKKAKKFSHYTNKNLVQKTIIFADASAKNIAEYIKKRITFGQPFYSFSQFAKFIDYDLPSRYFPICPPDINKELWVQTWRDTLKSNFNCHKINNNYNPNTPMHTNVSKKHMYFKKQHIFYPGHTVELHFFSTGPFSVISTSYITANQQIVSTKKLKILVVWGETLSHSQTKDFTKPTAQFENTLCAPKEITFANNNFIEPTAKKPPKGLFNFPQPNTKINTEISYFGSPNNNDTTIFAYKSKISSNNIINSFSYLQNHIGHDGFVSRQAFYQNNKDNHYFVTHAFSRKSLSHNFRNTNTQNDSHIANYNGSIEFWIKLDQPIGNKNTPGLYFPLFSSTTKNKLQQGIKQKNNSNTQLQNGRFHEGVQMFLFIDPLGYIHFLRTYYTYVFTLDHSKKIVSYGTINPKDKDLKRTFIRRHIKTNISNLDWQAHTWHHVIVRWYDEKEIFTLELDGRIKIDNFTNEEQGALVLNEIDPRDSLFINGFKRHQAYKGGLFPFAKEINLCGNTTIDNFISYAKYDQAKYKHRYHNYSSYTNSFYIAKKAILGPVTWIPYTKNNNTKYTKLPQVIVEIPNRKVETFSNKDMIVPKKMTIVNNQFSSYKVSFIIGKKENGGLECPSLGSISQIILFPYPKTKTVHFP